MLLNTLQWRVLKPFVDETVSALESKLGLKVETDDGFQDKVEDFSFNGYAVVANTSGSVEGRILIHHYTETALAVGNQLLKKQGKVSAASNEMNDEISNALADFSYSILEPAVKSLENGALKVRFSQAYFVADTANIETLLDGVNEIITVPIKVDGVGRFYLNYLLNQKIV
ncbi:MAG: hypothetical protein OEX07_09240 [Gammaproteobacteria bacterium]|nr:hypothetical protein [Gammaproteobacteria bacterium]